MERLERCRQNPTLLLGVIRSFCQPTPVAFSSRHDWLATRVFFEVLEDLLLQGWVFDRQDAEILAIPPDLSEARGSDKYEIKKWHRSTLVSARNEQLASESISRFIHDMERPRYFKRKSVSVLDLFLSPKAFASDLQRRLETPSPLRERLLREAIKPYMQPVSDERDTFTNLRLIDIWRYCRHTWSLPYNAQPGRQMMYLIRDAAREFHPIIGIGALGNSVIQITCRDEAIGWTLRSLKREPHPVPFMTALEKQLIVALGELYWQDLVPEEALQAPSPHILERLKTVAASGPNLSQYSDGRGCTGESLLADTLSPLYRKKRAQELYRLLKALMVFQSSAKEFLNAEERVRWLLRSEKGQSALRVALRCLKKRHIGTSVMEITTCGAVPPYSTMLGGKLVASLMTSPRVIRDYHERYNSSPSQIASRMSGRHITRRSDLVLLGTTSLYSVGSSIYSRVKLPPELGGIQYQFVGTTRGYGSLHISSRTYRTLQELLREHPSLAPQSSAFATGVNYKMRSIASGLSFLGTDRLQQHGSPRRVYLIPLARNWREYLWGLEPEPDYLCPCAPEEATEELVEFWKRRWFLPRVHKRSFLQLMANSNEKVEVSRFLFQSKLEPDDSSPMTLVPVLRQARGEGDFKVQKLPWQTLAELIRHRGSFAELLTPSELEAIHIPSKLDNNLVDLVRQGMRVYLLGNPGDGKTHLIKKHTDELSALGVFVSLDASAQDETTLLRGLLPAIHSNKGAVVAVNEGPMRRLVRHLPDGERQAVIDQLDHPYQDGRLVQDGGGALVVNLGLRRILSRPFIEGAFDLVIHRVDYSGAPGGIKRNVELLKRPRVRERITQLLQHVARTGAHVTMNQLLGFMSHIITAGIGVTGQATSVPPYYDLVFDPENPLHTWLTKIDPAILRHWLIDMWVWDGEYPSTIEWLESFQPEIPRLISDRAEALRVFHQIKRKYFFESRDGSKILEMLPADHKEFHELLSGSTGNRRELAKKTIMEALSLYFGQTDALAQDTQIQIWTSLRYEAIAPPTAFISSKGVSADKVELVVPQLHQTLEPLIEFEPSELRLTVSPRSDDRDSIGLDIDLELWLALKKLKRGLPQRFLDPRIGRRLNLFMARLAAEYQVEMGFSQLQIRNVDTGKVYRINVSLESGSYQL